MPAKKRILLLLLGALLSAHALLAQPITLRLEGAPLTEALEQLMSQSGIDVVYAERLVRNRISSCRYQGSDAAAALRCVLAGTGLSARAAGASQFVLVGPDPGERGRQTSALAGFILDRPSGTSLPGAHVLVPELRQGVVSSPSGYFVVPDVPAGTHRVRVSFVGYASVDTLLSTGRRPATIRLSPSTVLGESVLVESPEIRAGSRTRPPGLVDVPIAGLQRLPPGVGGRDLVESLSWMPGIRRAGEVTGGLVVRGAGPDQNLYLIDGAPIYHPWHAFSLISTFQTETYRDIRLYRGAFPAEYGGRLSSVIDASLSDGRRTDPTAMGAVNALSTRFVIESPIGPSSSFMLSGRRSYVDKLIGREHPVSDNAGRQDTLRTGYYFFDWSGKVVLRPDRLSRFSVSWYNGADYLDLRLPFDLSLDLQSWLKPADLLFEIDESWANRLISLRYERLLDESWYLTVSGYDTSYDAEEATYVRPSTIASVQSAYGVSLREIGLRVDADHFRSDQHQFRMGVHVANRRFASTLDARIAYAPGFEDVLDQSNDQSALEAAAYLQDTWRPDDRIHLVAGARLTYFGGGRYLRFDPRLSLQFAIVPGVATLRGSVTRNHQFLHRIRDRYSFMYDLVSARWLPSSEQAVPARGDQFAAGLHVKVRADLDLRIGTYRRTARNLLFPTDYYQSKDGLAGPGIELGALLAQYQPGRERASGLEVEATSERPLWLVSGAYTLSRIQSRGRSQADFRPGRYDAPHALDVFVQRRWERWRAGLSARIRSGYPVSVPTAQYSLLDPVTGEELPYLRRALINNGRLPAYWRVDGDVSYRFTWLDATWQISLQVYNLSLRRNVLDRFYAPAESGVDVRDLRGLPFLPLFEIELRP